MSLDPKRRRRQLAKSELLVFAAVWADRHGRDVVGKPDPDGAVHVRPFAEWGDDDPLVDIANRYLLTPADLERIFVELADEFERRAENAGWDDAGVDYRDDVEGK